MRTIPCGACLALGLTLAAGAAVAAAAEPVFDATAGRTPLPVHSASLELLAAPTGIANALLRVQFADGPDPRPKAPIAIQGGHVTTLLRDDGVAPDAKAGDGVFSALVNIDADSYAAELRRRAQWAALVKEVPVFEGRELLRHAPFLPPAPRGLEAGRVQTIDLFHGLPVGPDVARTLLIRDPAVVDDKRRTYDPCTRSGTPMGAWTFGRLMTEIANPPATGRHAADVVESWFNQWRFDRTINGFVAPQRAIGVQRFLAKWPRTPDGRLNLAEAPFRLLAIVNRQDLRDNTLYGGSGNGGEARLVFGALTCNPDPADPLPLQQEVQQFTVIFEYGIVKRNCFEVRDWARQWQALGALALGSPAYNAALQAITDQFTLRDANPTKLPNRSALNQLRSNEFSLHEIPVASNWQLRESTLIPTSRAAGLLRHSTIAQTPNVVGINFTPRLRDYIDTNQATILAGTHLVPLEFPTGMNFLGGFVEPVLLLWRGIPDAASADARHKFALATCSGCHKRETETDFVHIAPRAAGAASALSDFLTGANMPKADPFNGVPRFFHDLLDRQMKLDAAANLSCKFPLTIAPEEVFVRNLPRAFAH